MKFNCSLSSLYLLLISAFLSSSFALLNEPQIDPSQYGYNVPVRDYASRTYFSIELDDTITSLETFSNLYPDWRYEHPVGSLKHHYLFSTEASHFAKRGLNDKSSRTMYLLRRRTNIQNDGLISLRIHEPKRLIKRKPVPISLEDLSSRADRPIDSSLVPVYDAKKKFGIDDPLFEKQWHLINPSFPGNDINVTWAWSQGFTGQNTTTAIVDDGLDMHNNDLKDNYCKEGSWDFNDNNPEPSPKLSDDHHGTRCAGEVAAVKNEQCGVGVAFDSKVSGIRILSGEITDVDEAASLNYAMDVNDIYSCSWGPPDDGKSMEAPDLVVEKALVNGVLNGRNGKGSIFVFASGNGAAYGDSCNFDGYTNSIYSVTVSALDHKGLHPVYAEACSAVMISTFSSGSGKWVYSTDAGKDKCTDHHGGTSAAAPIVAGIYSLVLGARPDLTWRDIQYLTIATAVEVNSEDGSWQDTKMKRRYSPRYGFGKIDASAIVEAALSWEKVKPQGWYFTDVLKEELKIGKDTSVESTISVSKKDLEANNLEKVEHITVTVNINTPLRGDISVEIKSPSGIKSSLAVYRDSDKNTDGFQNWRFMSIAFWGEEGDGDWVLTVSNRNKNHEAELVDWRLNIFGVVEDASKAKIFSLDSNNSTTSAESDSSSTIDSSTQSSIPSVTSINNNSTLASPTSTTGSYDSDKGTSEDSNSDSNSNSSTGQGLFHLQMSYGTILFIVIIVGFFGMMMYFCGVDRAAKRRRAARPRESYEFEIIRPDDESSSDSEYSISDDEQGYATGEHQGILHQESGTYQQVGQNTGDYDLEAQDASITKPQAPDSTKPKRSETNKPEEQRELFHVGSDDED